MKLGKVIPNHILKLMSKQDRDALHQKTADELNALGVIKYEKDLHRQVENLLRLRSIEFVHSRMDKRTTQHKGMPDFIFALFVDHYPTKQDPLGQCTDVPLPVAWELKLPCRILDPDQLAMFHRLTTSPNAWQCRVIHSIPEALDELRKLGL